MIDVKVYNREGKELESVQVDEALFGGTVRYPLLKQAIVMYHANKRVGTAASKNRGLVEGSTRKLYKQKGTGHARAGTVRTPVRVGGGVAFAKAARDFSHDMPKKQRRLACDSALLAKMLAGRLVVVDELTFDAPKTREFARILGNLQIDRSCLVTISRQDVNLYKSARNVPKVDVMTVSDLNAGDVCRKQKVLFTKEAFLSLLDKKKSN
ncbi:MAG TPA: 50S ribosomal protein L4 [Anaerohalosphaeraceae bacterium]|nr:50S ribosomal protein L4 [Anaerohalosphaeraceae bacterium]HOL31074.1 50S ribosomal protein L4 [Anaerohalosphaeraceae bacterium]HOM76189.1 50S ribosomal protein L4 [Anaerohalosphaeraceae bacterium]HPC64648.1 50S ribosomal protein L4 [Anaerohalosphaeraceae bacterium]HPO69800.1 50S ribosomal protein L4 [Anaerohalosphaeraceae bacterium]